MHDCDHADTHHVYVRVTKGRYAIHYAVECLGCNQLIHTDKHGGRLLIKHSEVPSGKPIYLHDRAEGTL